MAETSTAFSTTQFLIVDDSIFVRRVMVEMLKGLGAVAVQTACEGSEALTILGGLKPAAEGANDRGLCVLTDVDMPKINGLALLRHIRMGEAGVPRCTPVIMLSGAVGEETARRALQLDVSAFVSKPVSRGNLQAAIAEAFAMGVMPKAHDVYAAVDVE